MNCDEIIDQLNDDPNEAPSVPKPVYAKSTNVPCKREGLSALIAVWQAKQRLGVTRVTSSQNDDETEMLYEDTVKMKIL